MSISSTSRNAAIATLTFTTLGQVRDLICDDVHLEERRRQEILSAFRTLEKALARRLEEEPAHPALLRKRLGEITAASVGLSTRRWANILSFVRFALKRAGIANMPGRAIEPLAPEWAALLARMNTSQTRHGLSRFAHYCSRRGIAPSGVDDAVIGLFAEDLKNDALIRKPKAIHRMTCVVWNKAVASIPRWPERLLTVPDYRQHYVLPWSRFPASLKADFDMFLQSLTEKDVLDESDTPKLKASSIKLRSVQLRAYISALVHRGRDPMRMSSLADVVTVEAFKDGLQFFVSRGGGKARSHIHYIACAVMTVARHWVKVAEHHLKQLRAYCLMVNPHQAGMTEKNRKRLRQFDDPASVRSLLTLPNRLADAVTRNKPPTYRAALQVQTALAIELLIAVPMRIGNLAAINLGQHIITPRAGGVVHLAIPGTEVKNGTDIEALLLPVTAKLLDLYLKRYRPSLLTEPSPWLFPGRCGRAKHPESLASQITSSIKKHCGLIVNPHLFRHIAAKNYLDAHPGAYGLVRLLLGHKSVNTTTRYYCGVEATAAFQHYDGFVDRLRTEPRINARQQKGGKSA